MLGRGEFFFKFRRKFLRILPTRFLEESAMLSQCMGHFSLAVFISAFLIFFVKQIWPV